MLVKRQALLTLLLTTIAASSWWWVETESPLPMAPQPRERRPDYRVDRLNATEMDAEGRVHRRLAATELRHFANDGSSELDQPALTVFTDQGSPWVATAKSGWLSEDGKDLRLHSDVVISRAASAANRPVRIETQALRVKPEEEYAETDLPVTMQSAGSWVQAAGLRAWLGESLRIKLLGRSRALLRIEG